MNPKFQKALEVSKATTEVPRVIMQTWETEQVPEKWVASPISYSKKMNEWLHILLTDADRLEFTETFFPDLVETYKKLPYPVMKADMIRYMWLYVVGGLYTDLDYMIKRDLSPLFSDGSLFLVYSPSRAFGMRSVANSFMACKPGNPVWLTVLKKLKERADNPPWWSITKHFKILGTTGPMLLQDALDEGMTEYTLLPTKFIHPCTTCDMETANGNAYGRNECNTSQAWVVQLEGKSWHGIDSTIFNFVYCNPKKFSCIVGFIIGVILVVVLYKFFKWKRDHCD